GARPGGGWWGCSWVSATTRSRRRSPARGSKWCRIAESWSTTAGSGGQGGHKGPAASLARPGWALNVQRVRLAPSRGAPPRIWTLLAPLTHFAWITTPVTGPQGRVDSSRFPRGREAARRGSWTLLALLTYLVAGA